MMLAGTLLNLIPNSVTLASPEDPIDNIQSELAEYIGDSPMGICITKLVGIETEFSIGYNQDKYYPVASTFKEYAALYYYLCVPEEEWTDPTEDSDIYKMVVMSNNKSTGNILGKTAEYIDGENNPIIKFNDFLAAISGDDRVGLYRWFQGKTNNEDYIDESCAPGSNGRSIEGLSTQDVYNVFTSDQLQKLTLFLAKGVKPEFLSDIPDDRFLRALEATKNLLSIRNNLATPIESALADEQTDTKGVQVYGKDGRLNKSDFEESTGNVLGNCITESVVIESPDGEQKIIISYMTCQSEFTIAKRLCKFALEKLKDNGLINI